MTIEKIYQVITSNIKGKISELELIILIQKFTNVNWKRSVAGYKMMRVSGLINEKIDRNTIGLIERIESNKKLMLLIDRLDCIPTKFTAGKLLPLLAKKMSEHQENEIVPITKLTPNEIRHSLKH